MFIHTISNLKMIAHFTHKHYNEITLLKFEKIFNIVLTTEREAALLLLWAIRFTNTPTAPAEDSASAEFLDAKVIKSIIIKISALNILYVHTCM